jgi:hypothetical protein
MTTQAYLLIVLILTVLLDLGLIIWIRRNMERRGITADDKHAVYLFNSYSPVLTWLSYAYRSIYNLRKKSFKLPRLSLKKWETGARDRKVKEGFQRKIAQENSKASVHKPARVHLRFQISSNERIQITVDSLSVGQNRGFLDDTHYPEPSIPAQAESKIAGRLRSDSVFSREEEKLASKIIKDTLINHRFFAKYWLEIDLILVSLAVVPVALVVMDRWLKKPLIIQNLNEYWNKIALSTGLDFPAYFLVILFSLILIFILLWLRKDEVIDIHNQDLIQENPHPAMDSNTHRLHWSKFLLYGSGICFLLAFFAGIRLNVVVGWWFLLAILMHVGGWLLPYLSIQNMLDYLKKDGKVILSYAVFCLALLYFLAAINLNWDNSWIFILIAVLTLANVIRYYQRLHPVLWLAPIFLILYSYRINGWEFSVIGDEYSFFEYAKQLATEHNLGYIGSHIFDGQAVFGAHPFFSSLMQAIPMKLFGVNNFAWRTSNLVLASASIPLFYYFFRTYTSQFIAISTSFFIGASHYIMTFGKIGYNNLQAFFMLALVLSISAWTLKTKRRIQYVLLGLSLGLCFYVFPAALYILGIWMILMLLYNPPMTKETARNWLAMGGMFLIIVLPLLVQPDYWNKLIAGTLLNKPPLVENFISISRHVVSNLLYSFFSFLYQVDEAHFVTVAYVDPLTAFLTLLGVLLSLRWMRKDRFLAYMWISFGALLLLVGASHDRQYPPTTRMFMLLPWFAFFASIGLRWLYNQITRIITRPLNSRHFLAAIFVAVIMLNLYQAYSLSVRRSTRYQSQEMLYLRLVQSMQAEVDVNSLPVRFLFLTDGRWDIDGYRKMQEVYIIPASFMELDRYVVRDGEWPDSVVSTIQDQNTLVVVYANLKSELLTDVSTSLSTLHKESCPLAALDGSVRIYLWYSPQLQWVCKDI